MKNVLRIVLVSLIMLSLVASVSATSVVPVKAPKAVAATKAKKAATSVEALPGDEGSSYTAAKLGLLGSGLLLGGTLWARHRAKELAKKKEKVEGIIKVLVDYGIPLTVVSLLLTGVAYGGTLAEDEETVDGRLKSEADVQRFVDTMMKQHALEQNKKDEQLRRATERRFDPYGQLGRRQRSKK